MLNILVLAIILSTVLIPLAVDFVINVVLPHVANIPRLMLNLGGQIGILGGGGGDEIDGEAYPT